MLRDILGSTSLESGLIADLLRVPQQQLMSWVEGTRPVPRFAQKELATILGFELSALNAANAEDSLRPTIWYKLRSHDHHSEADKAVVAFVRKLGANFADVRFLAGWWESSDVSKDLIESVRNKVDPSAPIAQQARVAAETLRAAMGWDHGALGIGNLIRPNLLRTGIIVVESSVSGSELEGCCFSVKLHGSDTQCVFANTYQSDWFRRNSVIGHEIGHVLFDLIFEQATVDYRSDDLSDPREERADRFARELLVPLVVLKHWENQFGIHWSALTLDSLAQLIAECHVDAKTLLKSALDNSLISAGDYERYSTYPWLNAVKSYSDHALTTEEFVEKLKPEEAEWFLKKRTVRVGKHDFLLPIGYLKAVLELHDSRRITTSRAAELTMMDRDAFEERFGLRTEEAA